MKKRILCLLLALTLLLSDAPLVSLATEIYDETQPVVTELPEQELSATEPSVTEPPVSEPPVTEPPVTEPATTEPEETQPEHIHTYTCFYGISPKLAISRSLSGLWLLLL